MKRGIAVRITIIFSGLVLLATGTTGYMVHQAARSSLMKSSTERLSHTAEVVRVRMMTSIEAITKDSRFLASTPPVQGIVRARIRRGLDPETALLDSEWRAQLRDIFKVFLDNRASYVRVSFADLRWTPQVLVSVGEELREPKGPEDATRDRLSAVFPTDSVLTPGYVYLSDIELVSVPGETTRAPMMYAAVPVFEKDEQLFGAVIVDINLRELLETLTSVVGRDKSLFVANDDGELLANPEGPYALENFDGGGPLRLESVFTIRDVLSTHMRSVVRPRDGHGAGAPGIAYFDRLNYDALNMHRHAGVAVVAPTTEIFEAVNHVEQRSAMIVLIFSLGGALIALGMSRFLTRPLIGITRALSHFGEDRWDAELPTSRSDEIGVLARAFNDMSNHIQYQLRVLEEKERHQRVILETAAEGIIVADRHGLIQKVNPAAERLFGYTADELDDEHLNLLLPPHLQQWAEEATGHRMSLLDIGTGHEVVGRCKDGSEIPVSLSVSEFEFEDESMYALFLEDISDRKEYEEALRGAKEKAEEMARLKTAFLANMSHELRTPLTAVIGYSSMLADELSEEHEHFAQLIERSGRRLMDTLNAVLSLAQLESQQMTVELSELNVAREVEEAAQFFETHAANKGLAFRCVSSPPARGALARVDRGALNSVLQNIIGNAIKFTENGFVEVRVHAANERLDIEVRDTGIGIDRSFLPHLFDAFRQESTGLERSHEGSGLGLALTKRLVDLMNGEIKVESVKGEGTTFTISFPHVGTEELTSPEIDGTLPESTGIGWKEAQILVVEDNPETAFLVRSVLSVVGDVTLAFSGAEALRKVRRIPFDLVLCDINLGRGPSGVEVLKSLRQDPSYNGLPVVALTAYALPGDREHFVSLGFDEYISKPFTPDALLDQVYRLLHRFEEQRAALDVHDSKNGSSTHADV